ncbi:MAG: hypothetical protein HYT31_02660 [Parcubacteria group bacterium]|nr:hypothetical protein [Parcubacteria group bacterium]
MGYILTGDQQRTASRRLGEILRQLGQDEYPYDPERALAALQAFHEGRFGSLGVEPILRLISGGKTLVIDETDGQETIPGATDLFTGGIDPDFVNWGANEASGPTAAAPVAVYRLARDATFGQMFGSVSADTGRLCLTQSQIVGFIRKYRGWLRTDGHATFFLFKSGGNFFIAFFYFGDRERLYVDVDRFEFGFVWFARFRLRLVLPCVKQAVQAEAVSTMRLCEHGEAAR